MKPNDANGTLPTAQRPFRVLVIAGSNRRQYNCPGVDSKAHAHVGPRPLRAPRLLRRLNRDATLSPKRGEGEKLRKARGR